MIKLKTERRYHLTAVAAFTVLILVTAGATSMVSAKGSYGILGQQAPELNLNTWIDHRGNKTAPVELTDFLGKVVYLYFFQSWCPGCHSHGFPTMKALTKTFKTHPDVVFLAVQTTFEGYSINTEDRLIENQDKYDLRIPMAHDQGKMNKRRLPETMRNYRSGGTPWTVIIDVDGTIVYNEFHISKQRATDLIRELLEKKGDRMFKRMKEEG